jgi:hypothetical protein
MVLRGGWVYRTTRATVPEPDVLVYREEQSLTPRGHLILRVHALRRGAVIAEGIVRVPPVLGRVCQRSRERLPFA